MEKIKKCDYLEKRLSKRTHPKSNTKYGLTIGKIKCN